MQHAAMHESISLAAPGDSTEPALTASEALLRLLTLMGIADHFHDFSGQRIDLPLRNRLAVLAAMGLRPRCQEDVVQLLDAQSRRRFPDGLPLSCHGPADQPFSIPLRMPAVYPTTVHWQVTLESGQLLTGTSEAMTAAEPQAQEHPSHSPSAFNDVRAETHRLVLPPLPAGYHRLTISGLAGNSLLISAPSRCHEPPWLRARHRLAGVSVQLYTLRSRQNWGIGDFTDLTDLLGLLAPRGVDFVVLNPLHALDSLHPEKCSPYSPMDRRFLNPLYLDVGRVADDQACSAARGVIDSPAFQGRLTTLRAMALVDYPAVARLKHIVLSLAFRHFRQTHLRDDTAHAQAFRDWQARRGTALRDYCRLEAERHQRDRSPARHSDFHAWLQWHADTQLQGCQQRARDLGMQIGLVRDLAVGGNHASAEVQLDPQLFRLDASIGAPPDHLAPQGQNWGLPPMDPHVLRETSYAHFVALLRENMAHCGALRIDHVMSLMRLWWCPRLREIGGGLTGTEADTDSGSGAYVAYPAETLFAILRLESERQACVVIGEDLGVVPPEIRSLMTESAVLSNALFYFEKYDSVHFRGPEHYPPLALAMVANHDVPTLAAWWDRTDLTLRASLGLIPDDAARHRALCDRESDLIQILHWLDAHGRLRGAWRDFNIHRPFDTTLCQSILETVAASASVLVSLQLEDLSLLQLPVNIPGTCAEYPNWQRRLDVDIEELLHAPERDTMLRAFCAARR